jgi:hypothetical protein
MSKTQADAVKIFKSRDSATSLLRKLGIQARDYNFFIEKTSDGQFACQAARAQAHLESLKAPKQPETQKPETQKPETQKPETQKPETKVVAARPYSGADKSGGNAKINITGVGQKPKRVSIADEFRELIKAGKTNAEVWAIMQPRHNLPDSKKGYPAWYRADMARKNRGV